MRSPHRSPLATDERGAVAVMLTLLLVVIVGMAAFAVDLGAAYANKRQLSIGADAAALAATQSYADQPLQSCADLLSSTPASQTLDLANTYADANTPGKVQTTWDPRCNNDGTQLLVTYGNSKTINSIFGGILGVGSLSAQREATAVTQVFTSGPGLRPYAICLSDISPYLGELSSPPATPILHISFYPNPNCTTDNRGNWYTIDCPGVSNNGTGTIDQPGSLAYNTMNGCDSYISVIERPDDTNGDPYSNPAYEQYLRDTCDVPTPDPHKCLGANTGNLASNNLAQAWTHLQNKEIALPVFMPNTIVGAGGNTRAYPVAGVVGIKVCGYHWQNDVDAWISTDSGCLGAAQPSPSDIPQTHPPTTNWLIWTLVQLSLTGNYGPTPPTCALGDTACDFGVHSINLVK